MDSIIKCLNFKTKKKNIFNTLVHTGSIKTKMGKKAKEHRKKVAKRTQMINEVQNRFRKLYQEEMMRELEKVKKESEDKETEK